MPRVRRQALLSGSKYIDLIPCDIERIHQVAVSLICEFSQEFNKRRMSENGLPLQQKFTEFGLGVIQLLIAWLGASSCRPIKLSYYPWSILLQASAFARKFKMPLFQQDLMRTSWSLLLEYPVWMTEDFVHYGCSVNKKGSAMRRLLLAVRYSEKEELRIDRSDFFPIQVRKQVEPEKVDEVLGPRTRQIPVEDRFREELEVEYNLLSLERTRRIEIARETFTDVSFMWMQGPEQFLEDDVEEGAQLVGISLDREEGYGRLGDCYELPVKPKIVTVVEKNPMRTITPVTKSNKDPAQVSSHRHSTHPQSQLRKEAAQGINLQRQITRLNASGKHISAHDESESTGSVTQTSAKRSIDLVESDTNDTSSRKKPQQTCHHKTKGSIFIRCRDGQKVEADLEKLDCCLPILCSHMNADSRGKDFMLELDSDELQVMLNFTGKQDFKLYTLSLIRMIRTCGAAQRLRFFKLADVLMGLIFDRIDPLDFAFDHVKLAYEHTNRGCRLRRLFSQAAHQVMLQQHLTIEQYCTQNPKLVAFEQDLLEVRRRSNSSCSAQHPGRRRKVLGRPSSKPGKADLNSSRS